MLWVILFGILQGLTEFFPISSSGHLVVFKHIIPGMHKWTNSIELEVAVHLGTTLAILAVFYRDIIAMLKECESIFRALVLEANPKKAFQGKEGLPMVVAILLASIPTAIIGLAFREAFEKMFTSVGLAGVCFAATGTLLWATRAMDGESQQVPLSVGIALLVGIAQGISIVPAISRSGATIAVALILGLNREMAGRFSFLLAVPAILGASLVELGHVTFKKTEFHDMIAAGVAAAVVGYLALIILMPLIKRGRFYYFAYYCWGAAVVALLLSCW